MIPAEEFDKCQYTDSGCRTFDSNRRDFLRVVGGSALAALMARSAMGAENQPGGAPENTAKMMNSTLKPELPRRCNKVVPPAGLDVWILAGQSNMDGIGLLSEALPPDERLYGALLERAKRAGGNLRGVLWYQGESGTGVAGAADTYGKCFERWVKELRSDLGNPTLPLVEVQLGRCTRYEAENKNERGRQWNLVRRAQYELPDTVPHTGVTSAIDLGLAEVIHLSATAQIRLGKRMARCMLGMESNYSGPQVTGIEQIPSGAEFGIVRIKTKGVAKRWFPSDNILGFGPYTPSGDEHPVNHVFNVAPDRTDPTSLIVKTSLPIGKGDILGYGLGMNPSCNAVDQDDMTLCAFEWKF